MRLGIRWTIGDVSELGYEALRCSIWGAQRLFGRWAAYAVCVNSVPLAEAQRRTGPVPNEVRWLESTGELPSWLLQHLDPSLAEGVAWKFAPLRVFPTLHELSLDNDCILWDLPPAVRAWLYAEEAVLVAEDVRACFGQFAGRCGTEPRNLGIRGLPPQLDFAQALREVLSAHAVTLSSELDEQGLQLAALQRVGPLHVVPVTDVSICSPFPPHLPELGRCGAHFCGLNTKRASFSRDGRPGEAWLREHWGRHRRELMQRTGAPDATA